MAWWFAVPVIIGLGKVIYDSVKDDSSSSSTTSNYNEQKYKAEQKAQREQVIKDKAKRKNTLIQQLTKSMNADLYVIKSNYLSAPENIKFRVDREDKLNVFSQKSISEKNSALEALAHLSDDKLILNVDLSYSTDYLKLDNEHSELAILEKILLQELNKA